MVWRDRFYAGLSLLRARRHRRILIASVVTLATSLILLALITLTQWRGRQAVRSDTATIITQASEQLLRTLQSRRGTLTLLRDTLKRSRDLSLSQRQALAASAVEHTRHLSGVGFAQPGQPPVWWSGPSMVTRAERAALEEAMTASLKRRNGWRVPSTFAVTPAAQGQFLIMLEPLRGSGDPPGVIIGAFRLTPLLHDFFTSGVMQDYPAQLLDGEEVLYRSSHWVADLAERSRVIVERPMTIDATRWILQMQPGNSRVSQTLSWSNMLLIALSLMAGAAVTAIVWILAARTWILQRAVARRTAALRRTLQRVRQLATTDELTGLFNRRFFLHRLTWECDRAKRYERPLACLMVDVNGFKRVNDRLGHLTGDLILKQVARELNTLLRQSDLVARFGGDEFVVVLPETTLKQAELVAEKLRQVTIPVPEGAANDVPPISLSVGISRPLNAHDRPEDLLEAADQSLYASKQRLENRIGHHLRAHTGSSPPILL